MNPIRRWRLRLSSWRLRLAADEILLAARLDDLDDVEAARQRIMAQNHRHGWNDQTVIDGHQSLTYGQQRQFQPPSGGTEGVL